jgi:hypothetical protein
VKITLFVDAMLIATGAVVLMVGENGVAQSVPSALFQETTTTQTLFQDTPGTLTESGTDDAGNTFSQSAMTTVTAAPSVTAFSDGSGTVAGNAQTLSSVAYADPVKRGECNPGRLAFPVTLRPIQRL